MNISHSKQINKTSFEADLQVHGALEGCSMTFFAVKFARQRRSRAACWKSEGLLLIQNISFVNIALFLIDFFIPTGHNEVISSIICTTWRCSVGEMLLYAI